MTYATLWVVFLILVGLFVAAVVVKLVRRAARGPATERAHPYRQQHPAPPQT